MHNISIMKKLELGAGDRILVYKANMIIPPDCGESDPQRSQGFPQACPSCGGPTRIENTGDVESLYCISPGCPAKAIKSFTLFVSRDAMTLDRVLSHPGKIYRQGIYP